MREGYEGGNEGKERYRGGSPRRLYIQDWLIFRGMNNEEEIGGITARAARQKSQPARQSSALVAYQRVQV
jgi:hypothetical protein